MDASRRSALIRLALVPAAFAGWSTPARPKDLPPVIRFGVANPPLGTPPAFSSGGTVALAYEKGWVDEAFRADGVKVDWIFFKGAGPAVNEALTNRQVDFAFQGDLPALVGKANGLSTQVLISTASRFPTYLAVPADSPLKAIADLRGKRVAFAKGTYTQLVANRVLEANGLSERDLRIVNLDTATGHSALATRDIDAVFGGNGLLGLRNKGIARIIADTRHDEKLNGQALTLVTQDFARAYPEAVARIVRSLIRAARWAADEGNREEVFRLWAKGGIPANVWREDFAGAPMSVRLSPVLDDFLTARLQQAVADSLRFKLIRKPFDAETWIDRQPARAALRDLKLETFWKAAA
jgi:sulfonate transport system substrate-binding protein